MAPTGPTMKWDTESDMKLFGLVLNLYDIKCSGEVLRKLNAAMGLTPKSQSIYHRLHAIRKKVTGVLDGKGGKTTLAAASPLTPRGPKLGGSGGRRSTGKRSIARSKKVKDESDSDDDDDREYILFGSPSAKRESVRTAGRKRSYQEPDTDNDDDNDDDDDDDDLDVEQEISPAAKKAKARFKEDGGAADAEPEENGNGEDNGGNEIAQAKAFFGIGELDDTETDPEEV